MKEGLRRLAILLRWTGALFTGGLLALFHQGLFPLDTDNVLWICFMLAPAIAGWALAWLFDGFTVR